MAKESDNYFKRKALSDEQSGQKNYNIIERMKESVGKQTEYESSGEDEGHYRGRNNKLYKAKRESLQDRVKREGAEKALGYANEYEVVIPKDVEEAANLELTNSGVESLAAPTQNPPRPRAYVISYNPTTKSVVIIMRSGAWVEYTDVSTDVWLGLKSSPSTNDYLPTLESNCSGFSVVDGSSFSEGSKTKMSQTAGIASRLSGKKRK
jgi:hypothetical protein